MARHQRRDDHTAFCGVLEFDDGFEECAACGRSAAVQAATNTLIGDMHDTLSAIREHARQEGRDFFTVEDVQWFSEQKKSKEKA
jgi:hypothetical protein